MDDQTTKPSPSKTPYTDVVRWNEGVSAPIIIPILIAFIIIAILLLCLIKFIKKGWDKKTRSNAYEITDLLKTEKPKNYPSQLPVLDEEREDHSNLNLLKYSGEDPKTKKINRPAVPFPRKFRSSKRKEKEEEDGSSPSNGRLQVEANVHDSSNENNDEFGIDMDDIPPQFEQTDNRYHNKYEDDPSHYNQYEDDPSRFNHHEDDPSRFNHHGSDLLRSAPSGATESEV